MKITITEAIETLDLHNPFMSDNTRLSESMDMAVIGLKKIQEINKVIIAEDLDDEKRIELINEIITTCWWREKTENQKTWHWIGIDVDTRGYCSCFQCSNCKGFIYPHLLLKGLDYTYCPNCGSKME